jgi:hypothetical protein
MHLRIAEPCYHKLKMPLITTIDYVLDGPAIESRWGEIFRCPDWPWGPPSLLYNGYRVFPGGKVRLGCAADHSPLLMPRSRKDRAIPLPTLEDI